MRSCENSFTLICKNFRFQEHCLRKPFKLLTFQQFSANNLTIAVFAQIEHPHIITQKFPVKENFLENLRNFMSCEYFLKIGTFVLHIGDTFCLFHKNLKKSHHFANFCERFSKYFATMR
jgi:hypothetical protein